MRRGVIVCLAFFLMVENAISETSDPPKEIAVDLGKGVKLELVLIPAGSFMMGYTNVRPNHKVTQFARKVTITKAFYLGKYEVTQEQWESLMGSNPSEFKGARNPVEQVSCDDCQVFFRKLNSKAEMRDRTFTLPTEAQWEYACRAGNTMDDVGQDDDCGEYAWYEKNSGQKTHPVGEKEPNALGLYDMHGNVWELCADWFDRRYYDESPIDDPTGPTSGRYRIARGGGWRGDSASIRRFSSRGALAPNDKGGYMGFRVARTIDNQKISSTENNSAESNTKQASGCRIHTESR